ncbi:ADP-ribosylglycohydrolase family protein [Streptomyces sp. NPDC005573]|uniref:ADP-ribosylglycohydrolase family protein n=1 Tax=Streptomyces sp. NPDC005573 TaxID=3156890 RepID=UPI0033AB0CD1
MASIACTPPVPAPGDVAGPRERARGALLGLAVGDALGAPAENLKPSEIRARWGRITGYVSENPSGTDDTEYAIFSGLLLARHGSALTPAHVEAAWHRWIAGHADGPFRGAGFSERGTLENLRRGLAAPISAQHRHAWSDGLAMRAAPFGVFAAGRPAEAARLVAIDGSVSHEGEGIYGGQAVAAGVAAAMAGAAPAVVVAAALAAVPDDSWTARSLRRAVTVAHRGERAVRSAVVIGGYPWTDLAPEAVALAFGAYAAADGDFREAVLTAVNMGRDADTTAAVAGALAGATQGAGAIPAEWAAAIGPARGRCLPSMTGHHILDVAELLVPEEGGKWGAGVVTPDFLPLKATAEILPTAGPGNDQPPLPQPSDTPPIPLPPSPAIPLPPATPQPPPPPALPTRPTEPPQPPAPASQPTDPAQPPALAPQPTEPPRPPAPHPVAATSQPTDPTQPPALTSQPTVSGGGWAKERGSRGRSPLVDAANPGQGPGEGPLQDPGNPGYGDSTGPLQGPGNPGYEPNAGPHPQSAAGTRLGQEEAPQ